MCKDLAILDFKMLETAESTSSMKVRLLRLHVLRFSKAKHE